MTTTDIATVARTDASQTLRRSLRRLDDATRTRVAVMGADVEAVVVDVADQLEGRARAAADRALRAHALELVGLAVVVGVVVGLSTSRFRSMSRH